ncbi:hypothetical protein F5B19DRAFT_437010 [Rostrohypoxylon terebratum]|nr:hypothetical protein F5B19DRAFT_437010 [Rostrohypoxylon terebratum]
MQNHQTVIISSTIFLISCPSVFLFLFFYFFIAIFFFSFLFLLFLLLFFFLFYRCSLGYISSILSPSAISGWGGGGGGKKGKKKNILT